MTKERPILFSGAMVRAILEGRKTQTRRVVKESHYIHSRYTPDGEGALLAYDTYRCPQGLPGDRLWVRETWQHDNHPFGPYDADCMVFYRADYLDDPLGPDLERSADGIRRQWRPSIHMPRTASRLVLEITSVRGERLNDCSEADAIAEGAPPSHPSIDAISRQFGFKDFSRSWFAQLWDSINGKGAWATNPLVWVIEFRVVGSETEAFVGENP